jgi:hypothetical protein
MAEKSRTFRVDFHSYRTNGDTALPETLDLIWSKAPKERVADIDGLSYSLYDLEKKKNFVFAEIARTDFDQIDAKGSREGMLAAMPLKDDEGQSKLNFFALDLDRRCMAILFQASGFRVGKLRAYINGFLDGESLVDFDMVFRAESLNDLLRKYHVVRKAYLKVRIPAKREPLEKAGLTTYGIINFADAHQAVSVKVELSMEHQGGTLKGIVDTLKRFQRAIPDHVDQARIVGEDDEGDRVPIDLLNMFLKTQATVSIDPASRLLSRRSAYNELARVLAENRDAIVAGTED